MILRYSNLTLIVIVRFTGTIGSLSSNIMIRNTFQRNSSKEFEYIP